MRIKNVKLEWCVLIEDFNSRQIKNYNIFGQKFIEEIHKKVRTKKITNLKELREEIRSWAIYHYWCKSEFEIAVGGLFAKSLEDFEKIDAYRQIEMNLDRITEYVNNTLRIFV
jgi:hypothetical protein